MIRPAIKSDSFPLAILHSETLTTSFLAELGLNFLSKLYAFLITHENVWVYEENNEVLGFVSFSENSAGMMKRFIVHCPCYVFLLILKTIVQPVHIKRFLETFRAPFKSKKSKDQIWLPSGELLSISVRPDSQTRGTGSQLVKALEEYLNQNQIATYKVVAGEELVGANKFYLKNGFVLAAQIKIHGENLSNVYIKKLK